MTDRSVSDANASWKRTWPKIVARAWADDAFMERLKRDPLSVAKEYDLPIIEDAAYQVVVYDNPASVISVVLSIPPKPGDLQDESLETLSEYAERHSCANSSTA